MPPARAFQCGPILPSNLTKATGESWERIHLIKADETFGLDAINFAESLSNQLMMSPSPQQMALLLLFWILDLDVFIFFFFFLNPNMPVYLASFQSSWEICQQ
jgi:hypothetical protein